MAQRSFRIRDDILTKAKEVAKQRKFRSFNAFVQEAISNELARGGSVLQETEDRIAATIERLSREVRKCVNSQQVHLGFTDALIRYILIMTVEPPQQQLNASRARAKQRYEKFLQTVSANLTGDLKQTLASMADKSQ